MADIHIEYSTKLISHQQTQYFMHDLHDVKQQYVPSTSC